MMPRALLLFAIFPVLLFAIFSCNPERLQHSDKLKQQMADMKIKRVTNADLTEAVDSWGEQLVAIAQQEATAKLVNLERQDITKEAVCNLQNLPKTQALAKRYGVAISILTAADRQNPKLAQKEREVLDAYLYNAEKNLSQISNIQRIADTLFVYNAVVPTQNILCQQCSGDSGQPLVVWRLAFPKREVIRHINAKKL